LHLRQKGLIFAYFYARAGLFVSCWQIGRQIAERAQVGVYGRSQGTRVSESWTAEYIQENKNGAGI